MLWLVLGILYIVCGILAYGMQKATWREFYKEHYRDLKYFGAKSTSVFYGKKEEAVCLFGAILGWTGLIVVLLILFEDRKKPGLCFRMPKELCERRLI